MTPPISGRPRRTLVLAATLGAALAFGTPGALAGTLPVTPSTTPAAKTPAPAAKAPATASRSAGASAAWVAGTRAYLVITAPGDSSAVRSAIAANGGTVFSAFDAIGVIVAHSA
ncbi:peptidase S8, partial [Streptomyces asoensis]